jgi:hypothetical protein
MAFNDKYELALPVMLMGSVVLSTVSAIGVWMAMFALGPSAALAGVDRSLAVRC